MKEMVMKMNTVMSLNDDDDYNDGDDKEEFYLESQGMISSKYRHI